MKKENANTLELVERIRAYIGERNAVQDQTGVRLTLIDDQTVPTREAIRLMENNAVLGLLLVLLSAWLFLGSRIALFTSLGIPFSLAGTFLVLLAIGETLNVTVLLGVVIVLGMLVDDAVVIVEAMYYRLQRGADAVSAALASFREVGLPMLSAVLTTMAAFLPLMLLPGILGDFMRVIPMVVTIALAISLVEAFWILPAHVIAMRVSFDNPSRLHRLRIRFTHALQIRYVRLLLKVLRRPRLSLAALLLLFALAVGAVASGMVRMDFFAADPLRLFYVNIEMPPTTARGDAAQDPRDRAEGARARPAGRGAGDRELRRQHVHRDRAPARRPVRSDPGGPERQDARAARRRRDDRGDAGRRRRDARAGAGLLPAAGRRAADLATRSCVPPRTRSRTSCAAWTA